MMISSRMRMIYTLGKQALEGSESLLENFNKDRAMVRCNFFGHDLVLETV